MSLPLRLVSPYLLFFKKTFNQQYLPKKIDKHVHVFFATIAQLISVCDLPAAIINLFHCKHQHHYQSFSWQAPFEITNFTHAGAQAFAYPRNDPGAFDTLVVLVS